MDKSQYRPRLIDKRLDFYLATFPAVVVEGPKWCGKTWTSTMHAKSAFMLADPANNFSNREIARLDVNKSLEGAPPHLIDEWQEVPAIWDAVRYQADESREKGRFILTGSSTPQLKGVVHSGTGRIASLAMHPMSLQESGDSDCAVSVRDVCEGNDIGIVTVPTPSIERLVNLVVRGGWPGSIGLPIEQAIAVPREYLDNIMRIDINRLDGIERDSGKVRKCLRSLARNESTTASTSTIRNDIAEMDDSSLGIHTVAAYLDAFRRMFLTNDTEPFSTFLRSPQRIKQVPKHRFCDPSLAAALLDASPKSLAKDMRTFGFLFESMAIRDLEIYAESMDAKLRHYQDYDGGEIDAVIQFPDGSWSGFEIKLNPADADEAALRLKKLAAKFVRTPPRSLAVVVGVYGIAHRRDDGVYVLPLTALCA
ncbi:MAG: ATP-binding protein [Kiritimatiellae bacterium]|nr:ATP-binding protein [Kiritimatiellia bacterium]